jgi:FtsP/CotA-like multicopper oxidase with cupredoxin domain
VQRTFVFGRSNGTDLVPWTIKTDGGDGLAADPHRVSAAPGTGKTEIWHIKLNNQGSSHPVHIHFEEGQILYRGGKAPPPWEKYARKDVYRIGSLQDSTASVDVAIRFREFAGTYVEHCHNTQHEDKAMLLRWDVQNPGQTLAIPTPMPDWDGVQYDPSVYLPTAKTGDLDAKKSFVLPK